MALTLALGACSVDVLPFTASPPGTSADGGTQPTPDGGPYILYASPQSGTELGGDWVTIVGGGFAPDASVVFGVTPTDSKVIDPNTISAPTPPSPAGPADITVQNPDGGKAVQTGGFYFEPR